MRPIVLNARAASRPELGGVERYAREVLGGLMGLTQAGAAAAAAAGPRPRYLPMRPPGSLVHRAGHAWEQLVLPARARARGAGIIFSPANLAPLAWRENVVVIFDVAPLRVPEGYSRSYLAWQRVALPLIARRAKHVVTVSEFSRAEISEVLGVARESITVIAPGVDDRFRRGDAAGPPPGPSSSPLSPPSAPLPVPGPAPARPYVLMVATATARKNARALERAAGRLDALGVDVVIAGGVRPQFRQAAPGGGLRRLGYVDEARLPALYAGALAFVLPSLYEGFGLTCLEAMAAGTPVLAANRAALPEACGDAALLVDPDDHEAVAQGLERLVTDESLRADLSRRGIERAARFNWRSTVQAVDELLARLERAGDDPGLT
ncbi:MAG TPA: glycosyltransferase family 1 protein [Solirubrobacteraceae bacterium]|jgi:glycosyltransferase involved in cell wall biosynthesis|nr:glycosyltransferase family 1 protein [Solirubrobacteraceae bacterium]